MVGHSKVTPSIRLAVVSAVRVAREALCAFLEQRETAISVAHQGPPSLETIARLGEMTVEVVLLDGSCHESVLAPRRIREALPAAVVVVYGIQPEREILLACARNGATIVASHDTAVEELVELVKRAASGHLRGEAQVNAALLGELALRAHGGVTEICELTRREREIALALAGGLANKEIAQRFCISLSTVKSHVHCILRKLGVDSRDQVLPRLRDAAAA